MLGLALLVGSFCLLSEQEVFPGLRAMAPGLGTALLIMAGQDTSNRVSFFLRARPLVTIGLVSYSAYLWHWPLLAFVRYGFGDLTPGWGLTAFLLTFVLATFTYRFVEQPARSAKLSFARLAAIQYLIPAGVIGCICLLIMASDGMAMRAGSRVFEQLRPAYTYSYVCQQWRVTAADVQNPKCVLGKRLTDSPNVLLWGDSNAAHYIGALAAFANAAQFSFRNIQHGACPPLLTDPSRFVDARRRADCVASLAAVHPVLERSDVIIISAAWNAYQRKDEDFLADFFRTARSLVSEGKRVILIGKAPAFESYDRRCIEKSVIYPFLDCTPVEVPVGASAITINALLAEFAEATKGVEYFDFTSAICPSGVCSTADAHGRTRYYDSEHLSMDGSWRLGEQYIEDFGIPATFASLSRQLAQPPRADSSSYHALGD
jgi:hypothetical protein